MRRLRFWRPPAPFPDAGAPDVPYPAGPMLPRAGRVDPARQGFTANLPPAEPAVSLPVEEARILSVGLDTQRSTEQDRADSDAAYQDVANRGSLTAVELEGRINQVQTQATPINVISFPVPERWVFRLTRVAFEYNDPFFYQLDPQTNLPWNLTVNDVVVPFVGQTNARPFSTPPGTTQAPLIFDPIWVKGGDTVAVRLTVFAAVTIDVNVVARIGGELMRPSSMKLGRAV